MTTTTAPKGHHHSAVTYEQVRNVISKPPDRRKDFEINSILPWFRNMKDTKVLGQLKPSILFDVLKNLQFLSKQKDELVIRQGDQGDCMYIMLRGQVTIYHNYGVMNDGSGEDGDAAVARSVATVTGEALRQQLGAFVVTLKEPGSAFGEVALLSDNGTRSASIIADEPSTDLIVIDRALYSRSVQQVVKREFEQKSNFIRQHPHFQKWQGKYLKQLTMALEKEIYSYEHIITKQAVPLDAVYFIISGEVKLVMDPQVHYSQFPKLLTSNSKDASTKLTSDPLWSSNHRTSDDSPRVVNKKSIKRQQPVEVCLLGVNEAIGDIETLMNLSTYMQTSVCTQNCELLVLNMKHYDRLFVRRNPRTIDRMKEELELRIRSRIASSYLPKTVPLLGRLIEKAAEYSTTSKSSRKVDDDESFLNSRRMKSNKCGGNADGNFIPTQGALLDQYGPGTVFYRIRQNREKNARISNARKRPSNGPLVPGNVNGQTFEANNVATPNGAVDHHSNDTIELASGNGLPAVDVDTTVGTGGVGFVRLKSTMQTSERPFSSSARNISVQQQQPQQSFFESMNDPATSADDSEALEELENRLRDWLTVDGGTSVVVAQGGTASQRQQQELLQLAQRGATRPRISRLHRASTEFDQLRPGVKIVMRRKRITVTPFNIARESSAKIVDKSWSESELNYYRKALTEAVPGLPVSTTKISR